MATLVLSAIGTLIGGPIGGAIGALAGNQVDRLIAGSTHRDGPRLKELSATTSSYGAAIPRIHGRMRVAGSIIWATDLVESSESSGGKGRPSITSYSYSANFAVALASRPIKGLGRIWADGHLLRGAAGDLKTGGTLRIYHGHGDQAVDPLIASDISFLGAAACPAFRHTAYAVFEDLQLADYGNRIPALTFEIIADDGDVALDDILGIMPDPVTTTRTLPGLRGFAMDGGPVAQMLAAIDALYPLSIDAGGDHPAIIAADAAPPHPPLLPPPATAQDDDSFGQASGIRHVRGGGAQEIPGSLRYYDPARDYQPGLQRAGGRARQGQPIAIEFPGALDASDARALIAAAAERAGWARETLAWRIAELDPALGPGAIVRAPGHAGLWRIHGWEWREQGVELQLQRLPRSPARQLAGDAGTALRPPDLIAAPTILRAFELPWDGIGAADAATPFAAASSAGSGWTGAALYADRDGQLIPLGGTGARRAVIGQSAAAVPGSPAIRLEQASAIEIDLASPDFTLAGATAATLANGANRALLGSEVIQFLRASRIASTRWRLEGLLRGRGGTESAAMAGHPAGASFILLDSAIIALDPAQAGTAQTITAIGLGDSAPVNAPIANAGIALRPLAPVHPRAQRLAGGSLSLAWTRRARGAWTWPDEIEIPLVEQVETYRVGAGPVNAPSLRWEVSEPRITIDAPTLATLRAAHPHAPVWVRQTGSFAQSDPLLLTTLS